MPADTSHAPGTQANKRILWILQPDCTAGEWHGANLRFIHFSRCLVREGHAVYFCVNSGCNEESATKASAFLDSLQSGNVITGYRIVHYGYPKKRGKLAQLLIHPALTNHVLGSSQKAVCEQVSKLLVELAIDVVIVTDRHMLFLVQRLKGRATTVIDWIDSLVLYFAREIRSSWNNREYRNLPKLLRFLAEAVIKERSYSRDADLNMVVSPVDKRWLDRVNGVPGKNRVLRNGVLLRQPAAVPKIRKRIIFSGAMHFPPNYRSALWYMDRVSPIIERRDPAITFVLAGINPSAQLLRRANARVHITGPVPDLNREIAISELYVAPMVSGGGFKNKVVEALSNGVFVVGTSMAFECFEPDLQKLLLVADEPHAMADAILSFLNNPESFRDRQELATEIVRKRYTWEHRARELAAMVSHVTLQSGVRTAEARLVTNRVE
jgi:glycosyltransferase involved in cell wall biosynthesis